MQLHTSALKEDDDDYTYADFLEWDEGERAEIFDGEVYMMGAPSRVHQQVFGELFTQLYSFLDGKSCQVYAAPFAVRLFPREDRRDTTVVEPDILVVCDEEKLDDRGCNGAPDLIIEIISPSSVRVDRLVKRNAYLKAGVREYWIVDPESRTVEVCVLEGERYFSQSFDAAASIPVTVLPECTLSLARLFPAADD